MLLVDDTARWLSILRSIPPPGLILELGCGDCRDLSAYQAVFAEKRPSPHTVALDVNFLSLRNSQTPSPGVLRIQADVRQLPFTRRFDLIVVRHPDVNHRHADWQCLFSRVSDLLAGLLLVTAYSLQEIDLISTWLQPCPVTPLPLATACLEPPGLLGRDRFVLAYRSYND